MYSKLRADKRQVGAKHAVVAEGEGVKTTENKIHWLRLFSPTELGIKSSPMSLRILNSYKKG